MRKSLEMTQRELALELGFKGGEAHVSNLESGAYGLEFRKLVLLLRLARSRDQASSIGIHVQAIAEAMADSDTEMSSLFRVAKGLGIIADVVDELIRETIGGSAQTTARPPTRFEAVGRSVEGSLRSPVPVTNISDIPTEPTLSYTGVQAEAASILASIRIDICNPLFCEEREINADSAAMDFLEIPKRKSVAVGWRVVIIGAGGASLELEAGSSSAPTAKEAKKAAFAAAHAAVGVAIRR